MPPPLFRSSSRADPHGIRALLVVASLCLAAYANALNTPFQFDDFVAFANYRGARDLTGWWAAMPGIRPLLKLSYALNGQSGAMPLGYHLVNLALHLANTAMVFVLLQRWPGTPLAPLAAAFGAAVFALHPAQTEAVTYLAGRSVSMMAFFSLAACLAWTRGDRGGRRLAALLFVAALASKETAVALPFALMLWDYARQARETRTLRQAIRHSAPLWALLCLGLLAMAALPRYRALLDFSLGLRDPFAQALAAVRGIFYLLAHPLGSLRLNIDPALPAPAGTTSLLAVQAALLLGLVGFAFARLRQAPGPAFALLWFFLHLAPMLGPLPRLDLANDRQLYLAMLGPAWLLAAAGSHLARHAPRMTAAIAVAFVLLLAASTALRNLDYRSEVALWRDTVRKSPHSARAWSNLGFALSQEGDDVMAAAAYRRALAVDPAFEQARINLGVMDLRDRTAPRR